MSESRPRDIIKKILASGGITFASTALDFVARTAGGWLARKAMGFDTAMCRYEAEEHRRKTRRESMPPTGMNKQEWLDWLGKNEPSVFFKTPAFGNIPPQIAPTYIPGFGKRYSLPDKRVVPSPEQPKPEPQSRQNAKSLGGIACISSQAAAQDPIAGAAMRQQGMVCGQQPPDATALLGGTVTPRVQNRTWGRHTKFRFNN